MIATYKYYLKPVEESLEECLATYGTNFHHTLDEAREYFDKHSYELGACVLIKVTTEVVETLVAIDMQPCWRR